MTNFVMNMYSGKGVIETQGIKLASNVTFEDPAAIVSTPREIHEAFRALKISDPMCLSKPTCINVQPKGGSIELTYYLNQRYMDALNVRSLLVVDFRLARISGETSESVLEVTKLEERWNGTQPLSILPFWISRRINGIISWNLTRILVGKGKDK